MNALQTFNEILQHADLIASAILQQTNPKRDLISQRKAFQEYGSELIKRGGSRDAKAHPQRQGEELAHPLLSQGNYRANQNGEHHAQRGLRHSRNT